MKKYLAAVLSLVVVGCGGGGDLVTLPDTILLSYDTDQVVELENTIHSCAVNETEGTFRTASTTDKDPVQLEWNVSWIRSEDSMADFSPLAARGNLEDFEMQAGGGFDLEDATDNVMSILSGDPQTCLLSASWIRTDEYAPGLFNERYEISFECPTLNYFNIDRDDSSDEGTGTLTNLSGAYECWIAGN